jgi:hypothetical protein
MSTGETRRDFSEIVTVAALDGAKPRVTFILPWRMDTNQDNLHEGLEECGCGFCPDDPSARTTADAPANRT